jgi:hypothetical protein
MALDAQARAVGRCRGSVDRLDVCTERIALVLGPDSALAIARYVGKPAAAWAGDHVASFYRTSFDANRIRARIREWAASNIGCTPQMVHGESDLLVRDQAVHVVNAVNLGVDRGLLP